LADVEVQTGNKACWFKVDENGQLTGGVSKFLTNYTDALAAKLNLKPGSFVCMAAGKKAVAQKTAGVIRTLLGKRVPGHFDEEQYAICWIVDFPMYEIGEESGQLEFCHNPFSMPQGGLKALEDAEGDTEKLLAINADQYDLVVNGYESASGAVRNHDPEIMVKAFQMVGLGEEDVKAKFPAMYNAFTYGAPPHAGAAPGVDRLIMLLTGEESIREVITFPMNKNAQDLMMGAPTAVDKSQLDTVHIALIEE
ncbi:MAG: amino acid--tRNA ligase-related protein, partial [Faecousia sp.]